MVTAVGGIGATTGTTVCVTLSVCHTGETGTIVACVIGTCI